MKKKKDLLYIGLLLFIFFIFVIVLTKGSFLYGSVLDWQTQHWTFAEYFRNLFYSNHQLFPSFAFNIGAGQNIYNFSYYGFLSPYVLLSYFFPFIKMVTFMQICSFLCIGGSIVLFYKWLRSNDFSEILCFGGTLLFLLSAPLILHSHRHIMFINYMPFLILGLMGVDKYFKTGKMTLIIVSVFLIIMTSYYYSIPSLMVIVIYGIFRFLKRFDKFSMKLFWKEGLKFLVPIFIGIMMAGILLLPTLYTILMGRGGTHSNISLASLIVPSINLNYLLYGSYSVGLTGIVIYAIVYTFFTKDKAKIFMGVAVSLLCLFPIFIYVLNGMLYVNAKVLIPLVPLLVYLITLFLHDLGEDKVLVFKLIGVVLGISVLFYFTKSWSLTNYYLIDILGIALFLIIYKYKKFKWGVLWIFLVAFVSAGVVNSSDELMSKKSYEDIFSKDIDSLVDSIDDSSINRTFIDKETLVTSNRVYNMNYYNTSLYSSGYNASYRDFYQNVFANPISYRNYLMMSGNTNVLWNTYMGVQNLVSSNGSMIGYKEIKSQGKYTLYENDNVYPIGYINNNLISKKSFDELKYPESLDALLNYTIIDRDFDSAYESNIQNYDISYQDVDTKGLKVKVRDNGSVRIKTSKRKTINIPLKEPIDDILLIRFKMNYESTCSFGDTSITINGIKNTLSCRSWKYKNENNTFDYVISSREKIGELVVTFAPGTYEISDIVTYIYPYQKIIDTKNELQVLNISKDKTKGDVIVGDIEVINSGYLTLSIPYDDGFTVLVDGKKVNYEKVNSSFIGFYVEKGTRKIEVKYTSPWRDIGMYLSLIGSLFCVIILVREVSGKNERSN